MHPNASLIEKLYNALNAKDAGTMASCYHEDAKFHDIAFDLDGKPMILAMWQMIATSDLRASFRVLHADDRVGSAELIDQYTFRETNRPVRNEILSTFTFRDGLISEHIDKCSALKWGMQAFGPVKGVLSAALPHKRREKAMKKLADFIEKRDQNLSAGP